MGYCQWCSRIWGDVLYIKQSCCDHSPRSGSTTIRIHLVVSGSTVSTGIWCSLCFRSGEAVWAEEPSSCEGTYGCWQCDDSEGGRGLWGRAGCRGSSGCAPEEQEVLCRRGRGEGQKSSAKRFRPCGCGRRGWVRASGEQRQGGSCLLDSEPAKTTGTCSATVSPWNHRTLGPHCQGGSWENQGENWQKASLHIYHHLLSGAVNWFIPGLYKCRNETRTEHETRSTLCSNVFFNETESFCM